MTGKEFKNAEVRVCKLCGNFPDIVPNFQMGCIFCRECDVKVSSYEFEDVINKWNRLME